jgi:hypothetical protein
MVASQTFHITKLQSRQMLSLIISAGVAPKAGRQVSEWRDDCGKVFAQAFSTGNHYRIDWPGLGTFAFRPGSRDVLVWPVPDVRHEEISNTFDRLLQPVILQALGKQALHAAAVVGPSGSIAFCGSRRSGKSTLGFAMAQAGYRQLADDALVLQLEQGWVSVCPLSFAPRLRPASRLHFGYSEKIPAHPVDLRPADLALSAIFLLRQDDQIESPRLTLLPQAQAFSALLAHAHCYDAQDPAHTRRLAESYLAMVSLVPVFALQYRPDLQWLSQLIEMIQDAAASSNAKSSTFRLRNLVP